MKNTLSNNQFHPSEDRILRPGLSYHFGCHYEPTSCCWLGAAEPGLRIILVLDGQVSLRFGDELIHLQAKGNLPQVRHNTVLLNIEKPVPFARLAEQGGYAKRVSLGFSNTWLKQTFSHLGDRARSPIELTHLESFDWSASAHALAIAQQMIAPPSVPQELRSLYIESRAIELLLEGWQHYTQATLPPLSKCSLTPSHYHKMQQVKQWLMGNLDQALSIEQIAAQANSTASTVQRHFKQAFQLTVFEFIHQARLEKALHALQDGDVNVTQAAFLAGYSNPNSFSTAFKNRYGFSPKYVKQKV